MRTPDNTPNCDTGDRNADGTGRADVTCRHEPERRS